MRTIPIAFQAALMLVLFAAVHPTVALAAGPGRSAEEVSLARIAAGLREYPASSLRPLLTLAEHPLVLQQLADDPSWMQRPQELVPPISAALQAAIRGVASQPEMVAVAVDHPDQLVRLEQAYKAAPQRLELEILRLRQAYRAAELDAAAAWQKLFDGDATMAEQYARLLTQFSEDQRKASDRFPYAIVTDRRYYAACPPTGGILLFARDQGAPDELTAALERWLRNYSPSRVDDRVLKGASREGDAQRGADVLAAAPPDARASMWRGPESGEAGEMLIPVVLQPRTDRPEAANQAFAVAEHARLWDRDAALSSTSQAPPDSGPATPAVGPGSSDRSRAAPGENETIYRDFSNDSSRDLIDRGNRYDNDYANYLPSYPSSYGGVYYSTYVSTGYPFYTYYAHPYLCRPYGYSSFRTSFCPTARPAACYDFAWPTTGFNFGVGALPCRDPVSAQCPPVRACNTPALRLNLNVNRSTSAQRAWNFRDFRVTAGLPAEPRRRSGIDNNRDDFGARRSVLGTPQSVGGRDGNATRSIDRAPRTIIGSAPAAPRVNTGVTRPVEPKALRTINPIIRSAPAPRRASADAEVARPAAPKALRTVNPIVRSVDSPPGIRSASKPLVRSVSPPSVRSASPSPRQSSPAIRRSAPAQRGPTIAPHRSSAGPARQTGAAKQSGRRP